MVPISTTRYHSAHHRNISQTSGMTQLLRWSGIFWFNDRRLRRLQWTLMGEPVLIFFAFFGFWLGDQVQVCACHLRLLFISRAGVHHYVLLLLLVVNWWRGITAPNSGVTKIFVNLLWLLSTPSEPQNKKNVEAHHCVVKHSTFTPDPDSVLYTCWTKGLSSVQCRLFEIYCVVFPTVLTSPAVSQWRE